MRLLYLGRKFCFHTRLSCFSPLYRKYLFQGWLQRWDQVIRLLPTFERVKTNQVSPVSESNPGPPLYPKRPSAAKSVNLFLSQLCDSWNHRSSVGDRRPKINLNPGQCWVLDRTPWPRKSQVPSKGLKKSVGRGDTLPTRPHGQRPSRHPTKGGSRVLQYTEGRGIQDSSLSRLRSLRSTPPDLETFV